jgi:hypothetical protein
MPIRVRSIRQVATPERRKFARPWIGASGPAAKPRDAGSGNDIARRHDLIDFVNTACFLSQPHAKIGCTSATALLRQVE